VNDYEGGDLEFLNSVTKKADLRKKGSIIIFPSFLAHRVTPVTKGTRLSLVGWIHGETYK
jgi:PKHD-type hydroxylase